MPEINEEEKLDEIANKDKEKPNQTPAPVNPTEAALATVAPTGNEQVDILVKAALAEVLPKALAAALAAQQEKAAHDAKEQTLREQGDYKALYEETKKENEILTLNKWRGEALKEANLDAKWFDSIQGSTKEEMLTFAKAFKKRLDEEIENHNAMLLDNSVGTLKGGGKRVRTRNDKPSSVQKTAHALGSAFGVNSLKTV